MARTCQHCDAPLDGRSPRAKYCSARCRNAASRRRLAVPPASTCQHCDAPLDGRSPRAKYCSARCRKAASRERNQPWVDRRASDTGLKRTDFWRTPDWLFGALDDEFHFTLDAASSGEADAKCVEWLTPEDDALTCVWPAYLHIQSGRAAAFCNPPFSAAGGGLDAWVAACARARTRMDVVMVGPARVAAWQELARELADEYRILKGRVAFVPAPGLKASSPTDGAVVVVFRQGSHGPARLRSWDPRGNGVVRRPRVRPSAKNDARSQSYGGAK